MNFVNVMHHAHDYHWVYGLGMTHLYCPCMLTCGKEANVDGAVFVVEAFDFCLGGPLDGQGEATGAGTLGRDDKVGGVAAHRVG